MNFNPKNRHLLISTAPKEEKEDSGVLLPEGYSLPSEKYVIATVLDVSSDCKKELGVDKGQKIVVDNAMIESVSVGHSRYEIVLENYVVGLLE
jgi:co-chaperonin GroES (HSP10)